MKRALTCTKSISNHQIMPIMKLQDERDIQTSKFIHNIQIPNSSSKRDSENIIRDTNPIQVMMNERECLFYLYNPPRDSNGLICFSFKYTSVQFQSSRCHDIVLAFLYLALFKFTLLLLYFELKCAIVQYILCYDSVMADLTKDSFNHE